MNRLLILACALMLLGCSPQMFAGHRAEFENVCGYLVHVTITAHDYSEPVDQILNPGERVIAMLYYCQDDHGFFTIQSSRYAIDNICLKNDYHMKISANGKELSIVGKEMLKVLEKADYSHGEYSYVWIIRDVSLCPGN